MIKTKPLTHPPLIRRINFSHREVYEKKIWILKICLLIGLITEAKETDFTFFTPKANQSALNLTLGIGPLGSTKEGTTQYDFTGNLFQLDYQYGLSEMLSIGGRIGTGTMGYKLSAPALAASIAARRKGMTDLKIDMKLKDDWWMAGVELSIASTAQKIPDYSDADTEDGNMTQGGHTLKPLFGIIFRNSDLNFGIESAYSYNFEAKRESADSSDPNPRKSTGGHILELSPFIEWNYGLGFLGMNISRVESSSSINKYEDGLEVKNKGQVWSRFSLFGTYEFTSDISAIFRFEQENYPKTDTSSAYSLAITSLGVRFLF